MHMTSFAKFWQVDLTRECLLDFLDPKELQTLRLVSREFSHDVAPRLFKDVKVTFDSTCFARQARINALSGIGHYINTFTFSMPHTDETFLPPLLHPETLEEVEFLYEPQVPASPLTSAAPSADDVGHCKWWSWELNDLLVRQYPLLFHAATNIESFIRAMSFMPCLRHLRISCPGQNLYQSHRRSIVDYALISLRIAIEQAKLPALETLSLDAISASSIYYLRPVFSIGSSPASTRVYHRIKKLNITMEPPEQSDLDSMADSLKVLHAYLSSFVQLRHLNFTWSGLIKGPCPLSLDTESYICAPSPLACPSNTSAEDDIPPTPPLSPSSPRNSTSSMGSINTVPARRPSRSLRALRFRNLQSMYLRNAAFDATQASAFIHAHRKTLVEFNFDSCHLRTGTWDDALEPLTRMSGNDKWKRPDSRPVSQSSGAVNGQVHPALRPQLSVQTNLTASSTSTFYNEIRSVPIKFSPHEEIPNPFLHVNASSTSSPTEYLHETLWQPSSLSVFDEMDDGLSASLTRNMRFELSRKQRGMMKLRNWGEKLGLGTSRVYRGDGREVAIEGARRLLGEGRILW